MKRNPIAKSLRVHRQQVVPDKRAMARLKANYDAILEEEIPEDWKALLDRLN